jgi:hypothetical protein
VLCLLLTYRFLTGYFGSDLQAVLRGCEAKYLEKRGVLKEIKKILRGGDVDRELTRIHQKNTEGILQMDGACFHLNGGLVAEAFTTSLRLNSEQMRKLEHWRLVFRRWKVAWTPNSHRCRVKFGDCRRIVARKANHRRRPKIGLRECVRKKPHCRAPKLYESVAVEMLRYEVLFRDFVLPLTKFIDRRHNGGIDSFREPFS